MAVPYVFVAGTTIEPDQVNDNFDYVLNEAGGGLLVDGTNSMLASLKLFAGTLALPGLTFDGDTNTGIYRSGADTFVFVSNGAAVATVSAGTFTVNGAVALSTPVPVASGGTGATTAPAAATALGLGTGDSPQFTAVNIGAATDTTLARVSAGVASIEGQTILTAATGQPLDATLTALAAYNTNGIVTQTAANTFTGRTITGTASQVTVTNGDGVAGNPTLSLPAAIAVTTIELGAASDTTLSRVSAGVIAVEGVNVLTTATGAPIPTSSTLPVGFCGFMRYTSGSSLANGATTDGSNVETLLFTGYFGSTSAAYRTGAAQTGTWKNVSGGALRLISTDSADAVGLMVRTV